MRPALLALLCCCKSAPPPSGVELLQQERFAEALPIFRSQLARQPSDLEALFYGGTSELMLNQFASARSSFDKVLALAPAQPSAWTNLGTCFRHLKRSSEAQRAFDRAQHLDPQSLTAAFNLAELLLQDEEKKSASTARSLFKRVLGLDPAHVLALVYLAELTSSKKKVKALLKRLMKLKSVPAEVFKRMATRLKLLGLGKEEKNSLQRALELEPRDAGLLASMHQNLMLQSMRSKKAPAIRQLQARLYDLWRLKNAIDDSEQSQWRGPIIRRVAAGRAHTDGQRRRGQAQQQHHQQRHQQQFSNSGGGGGSSSDGALPAPLPRSCQRVSAADLTPETFYSEYVLKSVPVLIYTSVGGTEQGQEQQQLQQQQRQRRQPPFTWDLQHLRTHAGNETVNVALTWAGVLNKVELEPAEEWLRLMPDAVPRAVPVTVASESERKLQGKRAKVATGTEGAEDGEQEEGEQGKGTQAIDADAAVPVPLMLRPLKVPMKLRDLLQLLELGDRSRSNPEFESEADVAASSPLPSSPVMPLPPLYLYQTGLEAYLPTLIAAANGADASTAGVGAGAAALEPSWMPAQLRAQLRSTNLWLSGGSTGTGTGTGTGTDTGTGSTGSTGTGPAGMASTTTPMTTTTTSTPIHFDASENILSQIHGSKVVTLFPPSDAPNLYYSQGMHDVQPSVGDECEHSRGGGGSGSSGRESCIEPKGLEAHGSRPEGKARPWRQELLDGTISLADAIQRHGCLSAPSNTTNHSPVDHRRPDPRRHPRAVEALEARALRCIVRSGERLFIPAYWHHAVDSAAGAAGYNMALTTWHVPQGVGFARPWGG